MGDLFTCKWQIPHKDRHRQRNMPSSAIHNELSLSTENHWLTEYGRWGASFMLYLPRSGAACNIPHRSGHRQGLEDRRKPWLPVVCFHDVIQITNTCTITLYCRSPRHICIGYDYKRSPWRPRQGSSSTPLSYMSTSNGRTDTRLEIPGLARYLRFGAVPSVISYLDQCWIVRRTASQAAQPHNIIIIDSACDELSEIDLRVWGLRRI